MSKKIVSIFLFLGSISMFFLISNYTKNFFDYHIAQNMGYVFYWVTALFLLSLLAYGLQYKKYKLWLCISTVYTAASLLVAYKVGDGNGTILDFDGKLLTLIFIGLYSFISIIYFIVQFFKKNK
jgi:hypothetical protein